MSKTKSNNDDPETKPESIDSAAEIGEIESNEFEAGAEIWAEFLRTGHVRDGYAVNIAWPNKARKIGKE